MGNYPPTPIENIEVLFQALEDLGAGPKYKPKLSENF
jgi:hypothetical protein